MSVIVLSLLGLLGLAFVLDGDDEPTTDEMTPEDDIIPDEDMILEEDPAEVLRLDADTVIATQGDDVITNDAIVGLEGYDDLQFGIVELNLLGGNDSVDEDVFRSDEVTLNAGDGSDTIDSGNYFSEVNGGNGDDVISATNGILNGDAGNDSITGDIGDGLPNSGLTMLGGEGDDALRVVHTLGADNTFDNTFALMTGGAGNDGFIVELLDGVGPQINANGTEETLSFDGAQVLIDDFVPGEDTITIDISSFTEDGEYELVDAGLVEDGQAASGSEEDYQYAVTLTLLKQGETEPFETRVAFQSAVDDVTLDDITILSAAAA